MIHMYIYVYTCINLFCFFLLFYKICFIVWSICFILNLTYYAHVQLITVFRIVSMIEIDKLIKNSK